MQKLKKYLKEGLLALLPIALIIFFGKMIWDIFNLFGMKIVERFIGIEIPFLSSVVSLVVMIAFMLLIGALLSSEIGKKFIFLMEENFLNKIPFIGGTILFTKSVANNNASVIIGEYPDKGIFTLGYATKEIDENLITVFFPTSPVVSTGFSMVIEKKKIEYLNIKGMRTIEYFLSFGGSISEEERVEIARAIKVIESRSKIKRRIDLWKDR